MIFLLYIEAIILIIQIFRVKLYKSSIAILYLFIINTFVSPVIYYHLLGGDSYINFSINDFEKYVNIGCVYLMVVIMLNFFMNTRYNIAFRSGFGSVKLSHANIGKTKVFGYLIISLCMLYILIYRDRMPLLYQIMHQSTMAVLDRPDVSGSIPHYFTMSTIMSSFFPMFFFYVKERTTRTRKTYTVAWYMLIIFILLVGGNKGMLVYFAIFVWMRIWKMKVDWRVVLAAVMLFYAYEVTIYGSVMILNGQLLAGLTSPLRRFFVTQGAMFINRIPIIEAGTDLSDTYISAYVYTRVYGGVGGSAPTYFIGDLMIEYGYVVGMLIGITTTAVIFCISKSIDSIKDNNLYKYWAQFYLLYLMGNSAISSSFLIRTIVVIALSGMLSLADKKRGIEENSHVIFNRV